MKCKSKNPNKEGGNIETVNFSSPNINIHIHVPSYDTQGNAKIFIPRIKPIIHLHFDEIARRLEKGNKSEEALYKAYKSFLPKTSPKFGDVKFHVNENTEDLDKGSETPCSTRSHCSDSQANRKKKKKKAQSETSANSNMVHNKSDNTNSLNTNSKDFEENMLLSKYKNLKLKKAAIVLTDVLKTTTWKSVVNIPISVPEKFEDKTITEGDSFQQNENKDKECKVPEKCLIEQENKSLTTCSPSNGNWNQDHLFNNWFENNNIIIKSEETAENTSSTPDTVLNSKNLTALAEGCSFSEILNRFKVKTDSPICTDHPRKVDDNGERGSDCFSEAVKENSRIDSESDLIETKFDPVDNNLINENTLNGSNLSVYQMGENNFNVKVENLESSCKGNEGDNELEFPAEKLNNTDVKSDEINITLGNTLSPEVIMDSETLKCYSSFKITNSIQENDFEVSDSNQIDVGNLDLHLHLIKKEMQRRNKMSPSSKKQYKDDNNKITKRKSDNVAVKSDKSPLPKKMKPSKISLEKEESTEDYIPLNIGGPTKFAVSPLDNINPYNTHPARSFKQEMLFGNRIARFPSSEKLKICQLKQAARDSASK